MEANEIHEFSEQAQEAGEKGLTHVSLIISVLAVLVAMVAVLGHREHTEAVLMQARAADQWNEYQSRRLRLQQVEIAADLLQLQTTGKQADLMDQDAVTGKLNDYKARVAKWEPELKRNEEDAHEFEHEVDVAERKAARYDLGEALLQIAVVLASVTLLTRKSMYVMMALLLGVGGLIISVTALLIH